MLKVNHLVFEYLGYRALEDVSFTIEKGSITALVGPNGAGKTTLMKCIAGISEPLAGSIILDGIDVVAQPREAHKKLAFLPDFLGLYAELSCMQTLIYFGLAHGLDYATAEARAIEVLELVQLLHKKNNPILSLSRGMKQRLAIAQAIVHNPQFLILDEPASGLDPEARYNLAQLFKNLQAKGITMLVSSHILSELEEYATHLLILNNGKVIQESELQSLERSRAILMQVKSEIDYTSEQIEYLKSLPLITEVIGIDATTFEFLFHGSTDERRELYMHLLTVGFKITDFYEVKTTMQEKYLKIIKG